MTFRDSFLLLLIITASSLCVLLGHPCVVFAAGGGEGSIRTCAGRILLIDAGGEKLVLERMPGGIDSFSLEPNASLVFQGIRMVEIDELRPGMNLEVDYLPVVAGKGAVVTWIDVMDGENKIGGRG
ncbi:MAG: hypothetical protein NTZ78_05510 [Candidatus Aureabacteria bacterium]|nr:hypothetical protein [Candidatus Auribacterota bacterium]